MPGAQQTRPDKSNKAFAFRPAAARTLRRVRRTRPDESATLNYARIIYELLTRPNGWRVRDLIAELQIKDRTYRHYRQVLQERFASMRNADGESMIIEVKRGEEKYLCFRDPSQAGETRYAHLVALYLATQLFEFVKDTSLWPTIHGIFEEMRRRPGAASVFSHVFPNINRLFYYQPFGTKDYSHHGTTIDALIRALINRQKIQLVYRNPDGVAKEHLLEPLSLLLYNGAFNLVARYSGDKRQYQFAVDRISEIHLLPGTFQYPSEKEFTPAKLYENAFGGFVEPRGPVMKIDLIFAATPWLKQFVRERLWHRSQTFEDLPDDRLRMRMQVKGKLAVARWVRSFGRDVELVSPPDLLS